MPDPTLIAALTFAALATFALAWAMVENAEKAQARLDAVRLGESRDAEYKRARRAEVACEALRGDLAEKQKEVWAAQQQADRKHKSNAANLELIRDQCRLIRRLERRVERRDARIAELERDAEWDREAFGDRDMRDEACERLGYTPSEN